MQSLASPPKTARSGRSGRHTRREWQPGQAEPRHSESRSSRVNVLARTGELVPNVMPEKAPAPLRHVKPPSTARSMMSTQQYDPDLGGTQSLRGTHRSLGSRAHRSMASPMGSGAMTPRAQGLLAELSRVHTPLHQRVGTSSRPPSHHHPPKTARPREERRSGQPRPEGSPFNSEKLNSYRSHQKEISEKMHQQQQSGASIPVPVMSKVSRGRMLGKKVKPVSRGPWGSCAPLMGDH